MAAPGPCFNERKLARFAHYGRSCRVGITFLDVAKVTRVAATRRRNVRSARAAYETVLRLLPRVTPSEAEQTLLSARLAELKRRLSAAGSETDSKAGGV